MKKALIDSSNLKVVQVVETGQEFEVHDNLYWVDCPDDADTFYTYDPQELTFEDPHAASKDEFGNPVEPFNMQRMRAYPPAGDQMDLLWKEIRDTGTISKDGAWFQSILAVKESIPKPTDYDPADPVKTTSTQWIGPNNVLVQLFTDVTGTSTSKGKGAKFKIRKSLNAYQVVSTTGGSGYSVDDILTLSGPDYDCKVSVTEVTKTGSIVTVAVI